jgi:hypothetical protein
VGRDAEVEVIALIEPGERAVRGIDRALAERARDRVRVELLDRSCEQMQALFGAAAVCRAGRTGLRAGTGRRSARTRLGQIRDGHVKFVRCRVRPCAGSVTAARAGPPE